MVRNSRKDARLIEARDALQPLLDRVADAIDAALVEFDANPRWCGTNAPVSIYYPNWNYLGVIDSRLNMKLGLFTMLPVRGETDGIEFHRRSITVMARVFRLGLPPVPDAYVSASCVKEGVQWWVHAKTTPRDHLDIIRSVLRWEERLDSESVVTTTFALLTKHPTRLEGYRVRPLHEIESISPAAVTVSERIHDVFRHTERALMPRDPSPVQIDFLQWIAERGGSARNYEVIEWLREDRRRGSVHTQDPPSALLRNFCEKEGGRGSRKPWRLRAEALELLQRIG